MTELKVPCISCVCMAICRIKDFADLYFNCKLVQDYFHKGMEEGDPGALGLGATSGKCIPNYQDVCKVLKPTEWYVDENGHMFSKAKEQVK